MINKLIALLLISIYTNVATASPAIMAAIAASNNRHHYKTAFDTPTPLWLKVVIGVIWVVVIIMFVFIATDNDDDGY